MKSIIKMQKFHSIREASRHEYVNYRTILRWLKRGRDSEGNLWMDESDIKIQLDAQKVLDVLNGVYIMLVTEMNTRQAAAFEAEGVWMAIMAVVSMTEGDEDDESGDRGDPCGKTVPEVQGDAGNDGRQRMAEGDVPCVQSRSCHCQRDDE